MVVVCLAAIVGFLLQDSTTSTFELDRDRASVAAQLSTAQSDADKYHGGAIKAISDARVETLRHTLTMLDQKRLSFVRRIALVYIVEAHQVVPATDATLNDILDELSGAEKRIVLAKADADRYSGGLVQGLKLATVATEELSAAQLRMKFYTAKYGFPIPILNSPNTNQKIDPIGKVVSDKDAL